MEQLEKLKAGKTVELSELALDALVCGGHDLKYPLDDSDLDALEMLRDQARDGQFSDHIDLGLDMLEDILTTVKIARSAVTVMSVLDEPMSQNWSNLPTIVLARCVNQRGHELMRGRLGLSFRSFQIAVVESSSSKWPLSAGYSPKAACRKRAQSRTVPLIMHDAPG